MRIKNGMAAKIQNTQHLNVGKQSNQKMLVAKYKNNKI